MQYTSHPYASPVPKQFVAAFRPFCLIVLVICLILWFAAPFMAVNLLTMGDQPTALQLITNDVMIIGKITETNAFWGAVISLIGLVVCLICTIFKKNAATRVIAIITASIMALLFATMLNSSYYEPTDVTGFGYIGIFVLLIITAILSSGKRTMTA